jgi:hypothetical protein
MRTKFTKAVTITMVIALLAVSYQTALAAAFTWTLAATTSNGGVRYSNIAVANSAYVVQSNLWNPPVVGGFTMAGDTSNTGWTVTNYTANSYFPNGDEPGCTPVSATNAGSDPANDPGCNWAGTGGFYDAPLPPYDINTNSPKAFVNRQIHAPAAYPDIYMGCHWGNCSTGTGKPFPVQVQGIASLQSNWQLTVPGGANPSAPSNGVWDAAYDIWLDTNARGCLPSTPTSCLTYNASDPVSLNGQNDGAEIMIWVNNSGYDSGNPASASTPIQPAGALSSLKATIAGKTWDVWEARVHSYDNNISWNVISYVLPANKYSGTAVFNLDTAPFIRDSMTRQCAPNSGDLRFPASERGIGIPCAKPTWWMTSVQAGFEIWNLPSTLTLATNSFAVTPVALSGLQTGNRSQPDGTPLVHWDDSYLITVQACTGGTGAQYSITAQDQAGASQTSTTSLTETPAGSGTFTGTQSPSLHQIGTGGMHGPATTHVTIACPGGVTLVSDGTVYIDPSGTVIDNLGNPVTGATVKLFRSTSATGTFTPVADGDTSIMDPTINSANPSITNVYGFFRWDVVPGFYEVRAAKTGCTTTDSPVLHVTTFPVTDVNIIINCGGANAGLDVQITPQSDWQTGYCRNVIITNITALPITWNITFGTPGRINNFWNVVWSQAGKGQPVTAHGVSWNAVLQPGQSTNSIGFCADR